MISTDEFEVWIFSLDSDFKAWGGSDDIIAIHSWNNQRTKHANEPGVVVSLLWNKDG